MKIPNKKKGGVYHLKDVTTADRLKQIMKERGLKQVEILEACKPYCEKYGVKLAKNDLSQYISGKVTPGQDKLTILGLALGVNEVWLMGYNVPPGKDELQRIEEQLQKESAACELFEQCYGKEAFQAVMLFLRLDTLDQGRAIGQMEEMLKAEKYRKKGSSDKKAI